MGVDDFFFTTEFIFRKNVPVVMKIWGGGGRAKNVVSFFPQFFFSWGPKRKKKETKYRFCFGGGGGFWGVWGRATPHLGVALGRKTIASSFAVQKLSSGNLGGGRTKKINSDKTIRHSRWGMPNYGKS